MARALFSKTCIDVPGSSAEEVAKQLRDQPRLVTKGLCDSSLEHHQARHIRLTYSPPTPVRASPADGRVHVDVERHFVIGFVDLLDQAGERVGDRIQRSRDVLVPNRDEGALELLGILI